MKIRIESYKRSDGKKCFRADFPELPGSPWVGTGFTKHEAVATLFIRNREQLGQIDTSVLKINGKLYEDSIESER